MSTTSSVTSDPTLEPVFDHPYATPPEPHNATQAAEYCAKLATSHYENFLVAGAFCPKRLRQHFYNVYAYCRISDDLGDEVADKSQSLQLLDWWQRELDSMYRGKPHHPVFIALSDTVRRFGIPAEPFENLLTAFRQDQQCTRYETFDQLMDYCKYSANPVGRLVLYLCGYSDSQRLELSDKTCAALQLANFWQDVTRDMDKDRVYIPAEDMKRFGYTEHQLFQREFTPTFSELMKFEVARTRALFDEGMPLADLVDKRLRLDIEMFSRGGLEVLRLIERQNYDVLSSRPSVPKSRQLGMLFKRLIAGFIR